MQGSGRCRVISSPQPDSESPFDQLLVSCQSTVCALLLPLHLIVALDGSYLSLDRLHNGKFVRSGICEKPQRKPCRRYWSFSERSPPLTHLTALVFRPDSPPSAPRLANTWCAGRGRGEARSWSGPENIGQVGRAPGRRRDAQLGAAEREG